jgi:hypothetical protein
MMRSKAKSVTSMEIRVSVLLLGFTLSQATRSSTHVKRSYGEGEHRGPKIVEKYYSPWRYLSPNRVCMGLQVIWGGGG